VLGDDRHIPADRRRAIAVRNAENSEQQKCHAKRKPGTKCQPAKLRHAARKRAAAEHGKAGHKPESNAG
jgi:hypothetical protein